MYFVKHKNNESKSLQLEQHCSCGNENAFFISEHEHWFHTYAVQDKIISEQLTFKYFFSNTTVYIALEDMEYSTQFIRTIFDSYYSLFWS